MIRPHGNDLIDRWVDAARSDTIRQGFAELPQVTLDAELLADLRNIATGVYSPLCGFMSQHDFLKLINDMTLESGEAILLVEEEDIPLSLRQAAVTENSSFVAGLGRYFDLIWEYESTGNVDFESSSAE